MQKASRFDPFMARPSRAHAFNWLRNPLGLYDVSGGVAFLALLFVVALAVVFGVVTVFIGEFSSRPIFFLALPLIVILSLAVIVNPQQLLIGLVLLRVILDPIFQNATLPGIGGLGGVLNFVIIALALTLLAIERGKEMTGDSWLPWIPFLFVILIGVVHAPNRTYALRTWLSWSTYAAVYHGAFYCVRNGVELDRMLRWLLISAIPVGIYAVVSYYVVGPSYTLEAGDGLSGRLSAPLAHPNILAFYFVVVIAAWLAKVRSNPGAPALNLRSMGWTVYLFALLALLAGTQTRGAWFGALFLFIVYGTFVKRSYLVLIAVGAVAALMVPEVRERISDLGSNNEVYTYSKLNSYAWRQYLWTSALAQMSPVAYLIGNGQSAFWNDSVSFFPLAGGGNWNAHNVYMQLLFDTGLVGVVAYLAVYAMTLRILWVRKGLRREVRVVGMTLLLCFAFMSYSDNMLDYLVVNWNCWFIIGLIVASEGRFKIQKKSASG